ncbi:MAG: AtpZ/AtpI family protein [Proteobacteria bacterium]|nr:AtpZ/AtpI family protein [Pseudomonadota bacterium]
MNTGDDSDQDALVESVRRRIERNRKWLQDGDASVVRRLAQIGVLGWMIVIPMLLGVFAGRWLDRLFSSGVFWTAPLLLLGLLVGSWSAWRWMNQS